MSEDLELGSWTTSLILIVMQAYSLGLGDQFEEIKAKYAEANMLLGDIVKVKKSKSKILQSSCCPIRKIEN